ncbi:hypothetical protein ACXYMU_10410 [Pontibacter sp. CAU 1760]
MTQCAVDNSISGRLATAGVNDVLFEYAHSIDENGTTTLCATSLN